MKGADYINASFVDVSTRLTLGWYTVDTSYGALLLFILLSLHSLFSPSSFLFSLLLLPLTDSFSFTHRATSIGGRTLSHRVRWSPL